MAIVLTDDETVTLDESLGLQNTGVPGTNEDNDDNDIALASLNSAFSTRLFDPLQLNLSSSFAAANGVAENDFISLTEGSVLTGFVDSSGDPLPIYDGSIPTDPTTGILTSFTTVDGEAIYLFADVASGLGDFMFLGVDANGDIVLAGHLDADGTISTVQFEAITNPDSDDHDDAVDLTGLIDVAASGSVSFDFDTLPSGANLFDILGASPNDPAIIIFGRTPLIKPNGNYTNTSDVIHTSQGGIDATIGVNNQMFDVGDGAYFVYVKEPEGDFLSGFPGGLTSGEADDADNILYNGGTLEATGASLQISQTQGNDLASLKLTTYLGDADQARDLIADPASGPSPNITAIRVYDASGTKIEDTDDLLNFDHPDVVVTNLGTATVTVAGLAAGYTVEWVTASDHNRVLVEGVAGKFDVGGFTITEGITVHEPVGDRIRFEDSGPSISSSGTPPPLLTDDTDIADSDSASFAALFSAVFGTDGGKDADNDGTVDEDAVAYALGISGEGDATGLIDSLTGSSVVLDIDGSDVIGTVGLGGAEVFRVSVDAAGVVTLTQSRAVNHTDPDDPDEADTPATLSAANLITLTATATDDDGDTADVTANIADALSFKDDGPAVGPITDGVVDFVAGDDVTNLLGAVPGSDGASVSITDFTASFDFGFATVIGVQEDDKTVVYYEDEDDNGVIDPGEDNAYFQLSLDDSDADPANWNYLFEVLQGPTIIDIDFDFDDLPSGANLFGVVGASATDPAIIVFGETVSLLSSGKYDNDSDVIKTSQGGTGATIGVDSQMFDPGDGAYFVYVDDPVADFLSGVPGGLNATEADDADNVQYTGGTVPVHTASLTISQTQGNELASMQLTTWLGDADTQRDLVQGADSGTSPNIVEVRVTLADGTTTHVFDDDGDLPMDGIDVSGLGTTSVVVSGLASGYNIEWVTDDFHNRVLVEGLVGKFDVGKFSITEIQDVPDAELNFEVTIEDFDSAGDTAVADFTIGIDSDGGGVTV